MLGLALGAGMISFSAVYVRLAAVSPTLSAFYRVFFGALFLIVIAGIGRQRLWNGLGYFLVEVICGFFFALNLFVWHRCIQHVGPGLATLLSNFQVFIMALIGIAIFREPFQPRLFVSIPLAVIGLGMIVGLKGDYPSSLYKWGIVLGIASAGLYAAYLLTLRKLQKFSNSLSPVSNLAVICIISSSLLGIEIWREQGSFLLPNMSSFLYLAAYGLFSQAIGWALITRGLPKTRASLAGLLLLLQPTLAFGWDILFFQKQTTLLNATGAILTLVAIYLGTNLQQDKSA